MPFPTSAILAPESTPKVPPRTVLKVEKAELVFVTYGDQNGEGQRQLALRCKDNTGTDALLLLDHREIGIGTERTLSGLATGWLKEGALKILSQEKEK